MSAPSFATGERVKMLPGASYPPTRAPGGVRYGRIRGMTDKPGMHLVSEDRTNQAGEWAYIVEQSPGGGAMWWSEKKLAKIGTRLPVIVFYYRGGIERGTGSGYRWRSGYSANSEDGAALHPWSTRQECQREARAQGARAKFDFSKKEMHR